MAELDEPKYLKVLNHTLSMADNGDRLYKLIPDEPAGKKEEANQLLRSLWAHANSIRSMMNHLKAIDESTNHVRSKTQWATKISGEFLEKEATNG